MSNNFINYFFYFKFFCLAMSCGFLIGIIYYAWRLRLFSQWAKSWKDWWGIVPVFSLSGQSRREWKKVDRLLEEPYESSWKIAVLKAEATVQKTLNFMGYAGEDFLKTLNDLKLRGYKNLEILSELHQTQERIVQDKNFSLTQKRAREIVDVYKKFLDELIETL